MDATPLIVTADEHLRELLLRLAAAAGVTPEVVGDAVSDPAGLRGWSRAPAVVVGADQAQALVGAGVPRRDGVILCAGPPPAGAAGPGLAEPDLLRAGLALGAERVVALPRDEAEVVASLGDTGERRGGGPVVAVVGGSGGAGASVLAAALAARAAARGPTLLVDLDPWGAGAGRLLGVEQDPQSVGWSELVHGTGRLGAAALRDAVPRTPAGAGVLGWTGPPGPVAAETVRAAVSAGARGHHAVVLDLPRHALAERADLLGRAAAAVLVCPATLTGACAAARVLAGDALAGTAPLLVVRGDPADAPRVGRALGLVPTAALRDHGGLEERLDLGLGPVRLGSRPARGRSGDLARAADAVWRAAVR